MIHRWKIKYWRRRRDAALEEIKTLNTKSTKSTRDVRRINELSENLDWAEERLAVLTREGTDL